MTELESLVSINVLLAQHMLTAIRTSFQRRKGDVRSHAITFRWLRVKHVGVQSAVQCLVISGLVIVELLPRGGENVAVQHTAPAKLGAGCCELGLAREGPEDLSDGLVSI